MPRAKQNKSQHGVDLSALVPTQLTALLRDAQRYAKKMLGTGGISSHHPEVARVAGEVRSAANKLKVAKAAFLVAVGKHLKLGLEPKPRKQRVKVDKPATKKKAVTVTASKKPNMGPVARMQARKKRLAAAAKKK